MINVINNEMRPTVTKSFIFRLLFDLKSMSFWYFLISIIILLSGNYNISNFYFVFIFCLIFLIIPFILSYRGNIYHVTKVKLSSNKIFIEYLYFNEFRKIEFHTNPLELEIFEQLKSSPDPTYLKFSSNRIELFRFYQSYGWSFEDLIKLKNSVESLQTRDL